MSEERPIEYHNTGEAARKEVEKFREEYRKAGYTEQKINNAVKQAQLVGELPYED